MKAEARPLYAQVRETLIARMAEGVWTAGQALPSEFALAAELGVSQGTVRKALDSMAAENLVERRQGRGTYVPEQTEARALYHFFRFTDANGAPLIPEPLDQRIEKARPPEEVRRAMASGTRKLWLITRRRGLAGRPALLERIYLDPVRLPGLTAASALPNALYSFYQSLGGLTVARAEDRLTAVNASAEMAAELELPEGAPLLKVQRVAFDLKEEPVEIRQSWCHTADCSYAVTLG